MFKNSIPKLAGAAAARDDGGDRLTGGGRPLTFAATRGIPARDAVRAIRPLPYFTKVRMRAKSYLARGAA
jgi:hypothetical protein